MDEEVPSDFIINARHRGPESVDVNCVGGGCAR